MLTLIQLFRRVQDNFKNSDKYIKNFEWAYAQDYQSAKPSNNFEAKQIYINKIYNILFYNYLKAKAIKWYLNLVAIIQKD